MSSTQIRKISEEPKDSSINVNLNLRIDKTGREEWTWDEYVSELISLKGKTENASIDILLQSLADLIRDETE